MPFPLPALLQLTVDAYQRYGFYRAPSTAGPGVLQSLQTSLQRLSPLGLLARVSARAGMGAGRAGGGSEGGDDGGDIDCPAGSQAAPAAATAKDHGADLEAGLPQASRPDDAATQPPAVAEARAAAGAPLSPIASTSSGQLNGLGPGAPSAGQAQPNGISCPSTVKPSREHSLEQAPEEEQAEHPPSSVFRRCCSHFLPCLSLRRCWAGLAACAHCCYVALPSQRRICEGGLPEAPQAGSSAA